MDRLRLMGVFVAVVDSGGFAGAARKLRLSPPAVTRAIADLEKHLGVRLLTRTTRAVRMTDAGARYVDDCRRILTEADEADEAAGGVHASPKGRVTVTAPMLFGGLHVMPIVTEFLRRYPDTGASCWFVDRVVNLMDEGADVAVRIGVLPNSSLQAVRVGQVRRLVCASPAYLAEHGTPQRPRDLLKHTIITPGELAPLSEWRFLHEGKPESVKLEARLTTTSNASAIAAAEEGFGCVRVLSYQVAGQIESGALQRVLGDYEREPLPVHVLHREGRRASPKVRAFLDLAIERLRGHPALL